jgi:Domain of unknown function (DUF1707)
MRASHADREQVIGVLQTAFVQGRLAKDEFDLRVGQTLAARTWAELAEFTADLPAGLVTVKPPRLARAPGGRPVVRPSRVITVATALYAGEWAVLLLSSQIDENPLVRALILDGTFVYVGVLIICVAAIVASRRDRRRGRAGSRHRIVTSGTVCPGRR